MIRKKEILLGVCPIGKFVFSHEDALVQKRLIFDKLDELKVHYCSIENVISDGIVRDQKQVEPVVNYFREKKIDALFVPHCNFGTEGAVGMIAKLLGVPVLLWGPRDEAPLSDGSRLRDTLCGMFASSKVLRTLKVPFTYIENCRVGDCKFEMGVSRFLRAAATVKAMRNMKIGQIGIRIDFFWTTVCNECELLQKFGVQVLPIDMVVFLDKVKALAKKNRKLYTSELADIKKRLVTDGLENDEGLLNGLAARDVLLQIADAEGLDAFSIQSFNSIPDALGPGNGLYGNLAAEMIPLADESDIHGAISSVLLQSAASCNNVVFFPEYTIRHPENDNAVLMWHGSAPLSLMDPSQKTIAIAPPWILKGLPPSNPQFKLKDGNLTVCRFDGDTGEYMLGAGQGKTVPGPYTREFYVWMEVDNWACWEKKIMEGPYIHHCSAVYDHCADILEEACKYIPGLKFQRFDMKVPEI